MALRIPSLWALIVVALLASASICDAASASHEGRSTTVHSAMGAEEFITHDQDIPKYNFQLRGRRAQEMPDFDFDPTVLMAGGGLMMALLVICILSCCCGCSIWEMLLLLCCCRLFSSEIEHYAMFE